MKYFTGRGDEGETSLASGRVPKTDPTVKAMGELDELNSFIGNALAKVGFQHRITSDLKEVEKNIYLINSELSSGMQKSFGKPVGLAARVAAGQRIFEIHIEPEHVGQAKIAAEKMGKKLGIPTAVVETAV